MKTRFFFTALALGAILASCNDEPEQHLLSIEYPGTSLLYADQTSDSIMFYATDTWRVTPEETPWIQVVDADQAQAKYQYMKVVLYNVHLALEPNTTGQTRRGYVRVNSHDFEGYASYMQLPCLGITRPAYTIEKPISEHSLIPLEVSFCLEDSASVTLDSLSFTVQNPWQISFSGESPSWLTLAQTEGKAGHHRVDVSMTNNESDKPREAKLKLVSGAVTDEITIRQLGK